MDRKPSLPSAHSIVAIALVFLTVVVGNVLTNGLGSPRAGRLAAAVVIIGAAVGYVIGRVRRFSGLDELYQRLELEAVAAAFAGSFLIFVAYWVLQAANLLPPLIGTYYVIGMVAMMSVGSEAAWRRLHRGHRER